MIQRRIERMVVFVVLCVVASGCPKQPQLEGIGKQQLETQTIDSPYKDVFRAVRNAFLNKGFTLKFSEMESGALAFTKPYELTADEQESQTANSMLGMCAYTAFYAQSAQKELDMKKSRFVEVTVTMDDLGSSTEIRTSFQGPGLTERDRGAEYSRQIDLVYADVREQLLLKKHTPAEPPPETGKKPGTTKKKP